ncbi:MAG TPA: hypothetical protein VFI90_12690 [Rubrobacter sp.]|nr:hypothetical protein [Rubrobacter sp.]
MSINAMTNESLKLSGEFREAAKAITKAPDDQLKARGAIEEAAQDNNVTSYLEALVKYIPTESITLYIATVAATPAIQVELPWFTERRLYWIFVVLTPVLLLLLYMGKRRTVNLPAWPSLKEFPWWNLVAATIAFAVWATAIPGNGLFESDTGGVLAGLLALLISTVLNILSAIFQKST